MKTLILDNLRSMNNVGAIFRSVDGAGWDRIILTGYTPTPPRKEISKTALWAEDSVRWEYYENPLEAVKVLKEEWYSIFAAEKNDESIDYNNLKTTNENIAIIVGNEVEGVQSSLLSCVDEVIHLPMRWEKSSLNVAVAAGVLLYHFS